ncbi:MAG TPA: TlyA family RNA methyltransferase [Candidatus Dormibacteraeota bacterium]|nr:TlyA family RNA methyltransferase [Candidatus Dormibacteraeota bacterium]
MTATRLDQALVERGLVASRQKAQALIRAGMVRLDSRPIDRVDARVDEAAKLEVMSQPRFVSRGGDKLRGALDALGVSARGRVCLDAGASTGGFTDVLLQDGASLVYSIDVGYGQLDWKLRQDERVVVMERTNIRDVQELPGPRPNLAVGDLSFTPLHRVVPAIRRLLQPPADLVLLLKPQFEVGRERIGKGGVVRDPEARQAALDDFVEWARTEGLEIVASVDSEVAGAKGNREIFVHARDHADG